MSDAYSGDVKIRTWSTCGVCRRVFDSVAVLAVRDFVIVEDFEVEICWECLDRTANLLRIARGAGIKERR